MFWNFLKKLGSLFKGHKSGYSLKGFWGETRHFNKDGKQIGYSVKRFWGGRKRYDMNGNLISYSVKSFWGGYDTYDANGKLIRRSRKNFWRGYNTYDKEGKLIVQSYKNFWEGMNHFDVENPDPDEVIVPVTTKKDKVYSEQKDNTTSTRSTKSEVRSKSTKNVKKEPKVVYTYNRPDTERNSSSEKILVESNDDEAMVCPTNKEAARLVSQQKIDKTIPYYESMSSYLKENSKDKNYARILAFSYNNMKEFPAIVHEKDTVIVVMPLIKDVSEFAFDKSELSDAKKSVVNGLDMDVVDNEFLSFGVSTLAKEFEELLPEYQFDADGVSRVQYEFKCGLVITERSMEELNCKLM